MHNWSDEEMDRLSREAAERYTPPAADGGWETLSRRLDVEMPVKDKKRRAFFWLFFAGLLLGGTIYWSSTHHEVEVPVMNQQVSSTPLSAPQATPSSKALAQVEAPAKPAEQKPLENDQLITVTDRPSKQNSSNTSLLNGPVNRVVHGPSAGVSKGTGTDRKSKVKQYQGKVPPAEAGNGDEPPVPARSAGESSGQSAVGSEQKPVNSEQKLVNSGLYSTPAEQKSTSDPNPALKPGDTRQSGLSTKTEPKSGDKPGDDQKPKTENPQPTRKPGRWEFSLNIAPDVSAVEFYSLGKVGVLAGGTVGFHIAERWTVSTGLFYTVKHYDSPGEAYHLPGYWANNPAIKMHQVNAVCNMWDIPLNIRYDLSTGKKMRFFASAGLSSYLMRKEDLHYYYTYNNNPYDKSYVYNKNKDYWFAIANVSAGMERSIGKGFSVQAEPFAKFSLADVGTGRIRLNSYGLFVGLKYRPFKVVHPHH